MFASYYRADVEKRVHDQDTIKSKLVLNFNRKTFRGGRVFFRSNSFAMKIRLMCIGLGLDLDYAGENEEI